MTITVKSCGDCPLCDGYYCNIRDEGYLYRVRHDHIHNTTHPSCPLRTEKITVELENSVTLPQDESSE